MRTLMRNMLLKIYMYDFIRGRLAWVIARFLWPEEDLEARTLRKNKMSDYQKSYEYLLDNDHEVIIEVIRKYLDEGKDREWIANFIVNKGDSPEFMQHIFNASCYLALVMKRRG